MPLSPEVREDAQRFQDELSQLLTDAFLNDERFVRDRWPFSEPQYAVCICLSYAIALRLMLAYLRRIVPGAVGEREAELILSYATRPVEDT